MSEAAPSITRRGFLGHVAGAYAATTIVSGTAVGMADGASATLQALMESHEAAFGAWLDAVAVSDEDDAPEAQNRSATLMGVEEDRLQALLRYRPTSIEEVWARMDYLRSNYKWWEECVPFAEEVELLVRSMMPEA